ncbi:MAG: AMP-binding protein, partial [Deltaproteobacteria bacterium]|nr:AMP-binding protein [Kofleriaceae bacterium]
MVHVRPPPVVSWTRPARDTAEVWRPSLVRTLDGEDEAIPLRDASFHRYTRQSTRCAVTMSLDEASFMVRTEREAAPWWEIDLGAAMYLEAIHVDLADVPVGCRVAIAAFTYATPAGDPPPPSTLHEEALASPGAHRVSVRAPALRVARHVRVTLHAPAGTTAVLDLRRCEVIAGELFAATLAGTMRRAFALHRDHTLFVEPAPATYGEVWSQAAALGRALAVRLEGDPAARTDGRIFVAVVTRNRPEWIVADQAILARGHVSVPMAPDDGDERMRRILALARPGCIVCEAGDVERLAALWPAARLFVVCDAPAPFEPRGGACARLEDLIAEGRRLAPAQVPPCEVRREDELYAVLFTSGSTGQPRGAMRTYATFHAMLATYGAGQPARHLSFQPLSHLSERMFLPGLLVHGATIAFSRGGAHLMEELRAFEPTVVGSVPRLFDVLHAGYQRRLRAALAAEPDKPRAVHEARSRRW